MRVIRYLLVGGTAAVVDISLFSIFAGYFGWPWVPVSIVAFILSTLVNYFLSIQFVFESGTRHKKYVEVLGVFIVSSLALIANQSALYFAIEILKWNLIISKLIATGVVFLWNYYGRSKFIF